MENLVELSAEELSEIEGGIWRPIVKELMKSWLVSEALEAIEDFADGWNSYDC